MGVVCLAFVALVAGVLFWGVRPRLREPDHGWRFSAGPAAASPARHDQRLPESIEKATLLGLLCIIFAEILPTVELTALEIALGTVAIVAINTGISGRYVRGSGGQAARFAGLLVFNLGLIYLGSRLLSDADDFPLGTGLFFAFLFTLLLSLYDRYKPIYDARFPASGRYDCGR